jgi:hypothetical protein
MYDRNFHTDRAHRIGQKRDVNVVRLISKGTVEELTYLRQIYKNHLKQDTLQESSDSKVSAPRVFRGVQGDTGRKGELFGTENLFRFKDGSFLDDIWAQLDGTHSKSDDLNIHESANLSKVLLGLGEGYERKLEENEDVDVLRDVSERVVGEDQHTSAGKAKYVDFGGEKKGTVDTDTSDCCDVEKEKGDLLESSVRAVNHADFFRSDRGRAAIPVEDDGYLEEMGGATQDMYAIFENTDVVDAGDELEGNNAVAPKEDDKEIPPPKTVPDIPKPVPSLGHSVMKDEIGLPMASEMKDLSHDHRAIPDKGTLQPFHAKLRNVGDQRKSSKIQLVGITNVETARTEFSTSDLLFPTYKKKKKKNHKKK